MKRVVLIAAGILLVSTIAWVQVSQNSGPALASLMPAGPMIYLEAKDFHSLLAEWNSSGVKRGWLASSNYRVFANSNLLQKLAGAYQAYGAIAGFLPGLPGTLEIAGRESALGLYDLREQYLVYLSRVDESQVTASQLWRLREKFSERRASGIPFWLRHDDASNMTAAFAFTNGWLVIATRDDLMANTLALLSEAHRPPLGRRIVRDDEANARASGSLAGEPWFQRATAGAGSPGELRMALNMNALPDVHFRSYWIQRNASQLRGFESGIADASRRRSELTERRVFLRPVEKEISPPAETALRSASALRVLAPADAVLARAWAAPSAEMVASTIETKLFAPAVNTRPQWQYAPEAASTDQNAGTEQDLETRIDEPPLASDAAGSLRPAALRTLIAETSPDALLVVQNSIRAGSFVETPCVLVLSTPAQPDAARVRDVLSSAIETLWSTWRIGVEWQTAAAGRHTIEKLNGLGALYFAIQGKLLFLGNDSALVGAALDRVGTVPARDNAAYTAEFRHSAATRDYLSIMRALEFGQAPQPFFFVPQGETTPPFFSDNLASLSATFGFVRTEVITVIEEPVIERQTVVYR